MNAGRIEPDGSDSLASSRDGAAWLSRGLLALSVAALLYGVASTWPRTVDDAYITFRHARNLAHGAGPVFNAGERVEGYSSPSFMLIAAAAIVAGLDPIAASKWLGVACTLGLVFLLHASLRREGVAGWGAALATLLLGSSAVLQIWAAAGMETNAYALAFFAGLLALSRPKPTTRSTAFASACLAAAALTRPEGLVFWLLGAPLAFAFPPTGNARPDLRDRVRSAMAYGLPGLALALHLAWRHAFYGVLFANTYYAKTGGGIELWRQGLHGLRLFVSSPAHAAWIVAAALGAVAGLRVRPRKASVAILAGAAALHVAYVVAVGDDGLRIHRFYPPILAPMAFLVGMLFHPASLRTGAGRGLRTAGVLAVCLTVPLSVRVLHTQVLRTLHEGPLVYQEGNERLGRLLARTRPSGTVVAVAAAGAIPYFSDLPTIDMYGLNDAHIARVPFAVSGRARLMKWDNAYVLSRRPDLIVINRGYFPAGDTMANAVASNPGLLAESPMDRDLLRRLAADRSYELRPVRFPDGAVFFVFERRSGEPPGAGAERS